MNAKVVTPNNANQIIKDLMSQKGIGQVKMTELIEGTNSQSVISTTLNKSDSKISMILRFLKVLDCDLIIRDRKTNTEYTITEQK